MNDSKTRYIAQKQKLRKNTVVGFTKRALNRIFFLFPLKLNDVIIFVYNLLLSLTFFFSFFFHIFNIIFVLMCNFVIYLFFSFARFVSVVHSKLKSYNDL